MPAATTLRVDFVSDIACPWCMVGLASLQRALGKLDGQIGADIHLQPFELDPNLPADGDDADAHLMRKYGINVTQMDANRAVIRERAAALGCTYNFHHGSRVWNTFAAHRLLHWADTQHHDRALALKQALFRAYFADNENVSDRALLVRIAQTCGLDGAAATAVLEHGDYAQEVRSQEARYQQAGIHSVPATIINDQHLIPGGQPPEVFERALRQIAAGGAAA